MCVCVCVCPAPHRPLLPGVLVFPGADRCVVSCDGGFPLPWPWPVHAVHRDGRWAHPAADAAQLGLRWSCSIRKCSPHSHGPYLWALKGFTPEIWDQDWHVQKKTNQTVTKCSCLEIFHDERDLWRLCFWSGVCITLKWQAQRHYFSFSHRAGQKRHISGVCRFFRCENKWRVCAGTEALTVNT